MSANVLSRSSWLPVGLGGCAAIAAVLPFPASLAVAALPAGVAAAWLVIRRPHLWLLGFLLAAMLLPPLPMDWGDSGPHLSVLLAALGGLAGLARLDDWRFPRDGPALTLAILWLVILLSLCAAAFYSGPVIAAASLARALLLGISVFILLYLAIGPGSDCLMDAFSWARILFAAGAVAAAAACIDFYYQLPPLAGYAPQFVWLDGGVIRRAQGLFYEASTLGNFCAFFLVMCAVGLREGVTSPVPRRWLLAGGAVFAAAMFFSYSRASIVNLAVALTALGVLRGGRRLPVRALVATGTALACGVAVAWRVWPEVGVHYWNRLTASAAFLFSSPEGVLSGRVASWRTLLEFIGDNPRHLLLGIGYKTLPYGGLLDRPVVADNAYLSALVETGGAGLLALLAVHVSILVATWRAARHTDPRARFFGAWIFCFWAGEAVQMLSGDLLTYWRVLPLYMWALAMAIVASRERPVS